MPFSFDEAVVKSNILKGLILISKFFVDQVSVLKSKSNILN